MQHRLDWNSHVGQTVFELDSDPPPLPLKSWDFKYALLFPLLFSSVYKAVGFCMF